MSLYKSIYRHQQWLLEQIKKLHLKKTRHRMKTQRAIVFLHISSEFWGEIIACHTQSELQIPYNPPSNSNDILQNYQKKKKSQDSYGNIKDPK